MKKQNLEKRISVRVDRKQVEAVAAYRNQDISGLIRTLISRSYAQLPPEAKK